jgi:hypothetical protein
MKMMKKKTRLCWMNRESTLNMWLAVRMEKRRARMMMPKKILGQAGTL